MAFRRSPWESELASLATRTLESSPSIVVIGPQLKRRQRPAKRRVARERNGAGFLWRSIFRRMSENLAELDAPGWDCHRRGRRDVEGVRIALAHLERDGP